MESTADPDASTSSPLRVAFSELVRLETELWNAVDQRLRRDDDLPLTWFEPMQVIDSVVDCRIADVSEALSITVGGASKLVDRIAAAGLCERRPNPADARSSVLVLTPAGRRRLARAQGTFDDELERCVGAAVDHERLTAFTATLRDLRRHLADREEAQP